MNNAPTTYIKPNSYSSAGQEQPGGNSADIFAATQSVDKGGMRGIGLVAAILAEMVLKNKALNLARSYYNTNKTDFDFFLASHKPQIGNTAAAAFSDVENPETTPDYLFLLQAGQAKAKIIDRQWYEARRRIPRYNVGQMQKIDFDMTLARTFAAMAGGSVMSNFEERYVEAKNDRWFNRRLAVANIGINVGNLIRQGQDRATRNLASAYDQAGDTVAAIGNGYFRKTGYSDGRAYVQERTSANQLPGGMLK